MLNYHIAAIKSDKERSTQISKARHLFQSHHSCGSAPCNGTTACTCTINIKKKNHRQSKPINFPFFFSILQHLALRFLTFLTISTRLHPSPYMTSPLCLRESVMTWCFSSPNSHVSVKKLNSCII